MQKPSANNFVQLEAIKDKEFFKVIHIISLQSDRDKVSIGRGHNADIKVSDISVSRVHAIIRRGESGYVLEDNESKFGSLLLVRGKQFEVRSGKGGFLQVGRTTLELEVGQRERAASPKGERNR